MEYSPTSSSDPFMLTPSLDFPETSSYRGAASPSDEEPILAASHPKRRAGRKKVKETRHPLYHGVRQRNTNKWVCELREPCKQKRIWLGTYPTAEMAARAHDVAALALRGNTACLNFADSVWRLPIPASNDPKDLRKAAAAAAEAFRTTSTDEALEVYMEQQNEEERVRKYEEDKGGFPELYNVVYEDWSMAAEGVMLSPPPYAGGYSFSWDEVESEAELELWNFS